MNKIIYLLLATTLLFSCKQRSKYTDPDQKVDVGTIKGETYTNEDIGWTIVIPKGWTVISRGQTEANEKKGADAIRKSSHKEIDMSSLRHLISFQKGKFNSFMSTLDSLPNATPESFEVNCAAVGKVIYDAYTSQGIKSDTSSGTAVIRGRRFHVFYATIYNREGKALLRQELYSKLMGDNIFSVTFNYTNEADKKEMMDAFKNSRFTGE